MHDLNEPLHQEDLQQPDPMLNGTRGKISKGVGFKGLGGFFKGFVKQQIENHVEKKIGTLGAANLLLGHKDNIDNNQNLSDEENHHPRNNDNLNISANKSREINKERDDAIAKMEITRKYNLVQPNHLGVCFFHLVFKIFSIL